MFGTCSRSYTTDNWIVVGSISNSMAVDSSNARSNKVLFSASSCHMVHDGYSNLLYTLAPLWALAYGFNATQVGILVGGYVGAMALFQIPAGFLAERIGERLPLVAGMLLVATAFTAVGLVESYEAFLLLLILAGIGSGVQHPLSSSIISSAFTPERRRVALGVYNFAGDVGKASYPVLAAALMLVLSWRSTTLVFGCVTVFLGMAIFLMLRSLKVGEHPRQVKRPEGIAKVSGWGILRPRSFTLLSLIGMLDSAARMGFLTFIPFLLVAKGMGIERTGFAFGLVFVGGAFGKYVCGLLAARLGVIRTVLITEVATGVGILLALVLPLEPLFWTLPIIGVAMNGTSTVLYGSVADFVSEERQARGYGLFYTLLFGASAMAPVTLGLINDGVGLEFSIAAIGVLALLTLPLLIPMSRELRAA